MDWFSIGLIALLAVMIIFMFRSSRRRRREAEELQTKIQPGAEVMTQHGIYGKLLSIDEESNEALIETTPGTILRMHRQVIARVVDPTEAEDEANVRELDTLEDTGSVVDRDAELTDEPEFGERIEKPKQPRSRKKPTE
jgi:preprotein translocase subunit YajC